MDNVYVGQILLLPYNFSPVNLAPCDGQLLQITQNTALFSLIGTNFGGDGQKTFALPNYQGLAPKGSQYFIVLNGIFPAEIVTQIAVILCDHFLTVTNRHLRVRCVSSASYQEVALADRPSSIPQGSSFG